MIKVCFFFVSHSLAHLWAFFKLLSRYVLSLVRKHNRYQIHDILKYWKGYDLKINIHCSSRSNTSSWQIPCPEIEWASKINGSLLAVLSFCMEAELRNSCLKSLKVPILNKIPKLYLIEAVYRSLSWEQKGIVGSLTADSSICKTCRECWEDRANTNQTPPAHFGRNTFAPGGLQEVLHFTLQCTYFAACHKLGNTVFFFFFF